mmetsp:Transcript_8063/g.17477  ORF Transcript_8063/g.17477 Transcript_8063/m.17477 type:complete len:195 (-) Transcript_8063:363-947(-)
MITIKTVSLRFLFSLLLLSDSIHRSHIHTHGALAFQLQSSATIRNIQRDELHDFLATPTHWPEIVLSSHSVKCPPSSSNDRIDVPLKEGDAVEEIFGLPPLLPLSVMWKCVKSDKPNGRLEFYSDEGVPGFADRCAMKFDISEYPERKCCSVDLAMEFMPLNPIVPLGIPLLNLDNNLAINVLLPKALEKSARN